MTDYRVALRCLAAGLGGLVLAIVPPAQAAADTDAGQSAPRFGRPVWSPDDRYLALSGDGRNGVYIYDTADETCLQITDAPGSGYACHWSADGRRLGFKLLVPATARVFPLQVPVIFDLDRRTLMPLHAPVARAGVPSFANDGRVAFTIDQDLHVIDASGRRVAQRPLGHYANLAPISPDGTRVVYNDRSGRLQLLDLATGATTTLTFDDHAWFNPVWSPDSSRLVASTVSGRLRTIDLETGLLHELDQGTSPSWSPDGETVFYTKTDRVHGQRVIGMDVCCVGWDGRGRQRLAGTPGEHEADACVSADGRRIAFVSGLTGELCRAHLFRHEVPQDSGRSTVRYAMGQVTRSASKPMAVTSLEPDTATECLSPTVSGEPAVSSTVMLTRTVPYLHQVYDTRDDFNGHSACGASSALMAINYFYVLPHWDVTCSSPYSHTSHYGQYVSEIYTFNGYTYDIRGKDPSGDWAYGGYGYIIQNNWEDTKGHMRDYIINHGLESAVDWAPTWGKLQSEIDNDDPFVLLNSLTEAGHYIVTIGYYDSQYTAVFNDPYGNKNTPGYPSYDGAGAMYDWPGYSNGFANLETVWCFIYCRGVLPPVILQHPQAQAVAWRDNASFYVEAVGEGQLAYQWQKDALDLAEGGHYGGVATDTLTVFHVTDLQAGGYRCRVTNSYGSAFSDPATLTVLGSPIAPGDMDADDDVDQSDFGLFQRCLTGMSVPQTDPACADALLDNDRDVDRDDTVIFMRCLSGAGIPADVYCAD